MCNIPRVSSLNAIPVAFGSGSKIVSNVYHIIWKAMYTLAADSHPRVSTAAQVIIDEVRSRSLSETSNESLKESKSNSSISESSSPNTAATFSISESPPSANYTIKKMPASSSGLAGETTGTMSTVLTAVTNAFSSSPSRVITGAATTAGAAANEYSNINTTINRESHNGQNTNFQAQQLPVNLTAINSSATCNADNSMSVSNSNQQVPTNINIERITKSANVAISKARRYASSRDNNMSEDDNRSNLSSQKPSITTDFVDWCTKYFVDPENNFTSARISNGKEDQQREWRMLRVLSYKNVCMRELLVVDPTRFDEHVSSYKVSQVPNLVAVHPYDPIMVIAGRDEFSVMHLDGPHVNNYNHLDTSSLSANISTSASIGSNSIFCSGVNTGNNQNQNLNHIHAGQNIHHHHLHHHHPVQNQNNHQPLNQPSQIGNESHNLHDLIGTQSNCHSNSSQITSLQLINPQYNSLICTGSSEGSVRIWRAYNGIDYSFNPQLVSAFHLMPELQPYRHGLGMILLWDQNQSRFYATSDQNDVRIIKVWDASSESKIQDIPTCAEFGVSCLSSDGEHSIAAGFLDGSIRIYDTRLKKTDCRTFTFRKHSEKILNLHMFKPGEKHINLVSGDSGGEVRFWDKRAPTSVKRVDVGQKMSAMSVHPNADVFACGLKFGHGIKIYNLDGTSRASCVIKCQENTFFASRHDPSVSCLAFHPLKTSLVAGYSDAILSIFSVNQQAK